MSIPRYEATITYLNNDGSTYTKKCIASTLEPNRTVEKIMSGNAAYNYAQGMGRYANLGGSVFTQRQLPYYVDQKNAIKASDHIADQIGPFVDFMMEKMLVPGTTGTWYSYNQQQFASRRQALCGGSTSQVFLYLRGDISYNYYNASNLQHIISAQVFIDMASGTWDTANGVWNITPYNYTDLARWDVVSTNLSSNWVSIMKEALENISHLTLYPTLFYYDNGQKKFLVRNVSAIGFLAYAENDPAFLAQTTPVPYALVSEGRVYNVGVNWSTSGGTVDPTDPDIDPDPYDDDDPPDDPPDPGDHDEGDNPPSVPGIPSISGAGAGLYRVFKPTTAQLGQLANKLWDPDVWSAIKQMFTNPMEAILGLSIVPLDPSTPSSDTIYLGHYNTEIAAPRVYDEYVILDCGRLPITNYYGSYLDYDPYTTYSLHLPYIGELEISADEITGKTLGLIYHCNVVTGDCAALITANDGVIATMSGNLIRQLPLSQTDYTNIIQTAVSGVSSAVALGVGVAGASQVAGALSASSTASQTAKVAASNRVSSAGVNGSTSLLTDVMSAKYHYKHAGKIGNGAAQLSNQRPFLTIIRPNLALPENNDASQQSNLKAYTGYPSNRIVSLSSCHGFTQIESAKLSIPSATDEEVAELYSLLKGGVLL